MCFKWVLFVLQTSKLLKTSCSDKISVFTRFSVCNCLLQSSKAVRNCSSYSLHYIFSSYSIRWKEVLHLHLSRPYCEDLLGARWLLFLAFPRQGNLMKSRGWGKKRRCGYPFLHTAQHDTLLIQVSDTTSGLLLLHNCLFCCGTLYLLCTLH